MRPGRKQMSFSSNQGKSQINHLHNIPSPRICAQRREKHHNIRSSEATCGALSMVCNFSRGTYDTRDCLIHQHVIPFVGEKHHHSYLSLYRSIFCRLNFVLIVHFHGNLSVSQFWTNCTINNSISASNNIISNNCSGLENAKY